MEVAELLRYLAGEAVPADVEVHEIGHAGDGGWNVAGELVVGEVEEAEAGELADVGGDGAGEAVAGEVEDAEVWEGGGDAGRDGAGDGLPVGDDERGEAGEQADCRRDRPGHVAGAAGEDRILALPANVDAGDPAGGGVAADAVPARAAVAAGVPGLEEADAPLRERRPELGQRRPVIVGARHGRRRRDDGDRDDDGDDGCGDGGGSHWVLRLECRRWSVVFAARIVLYSKSILYIDMEFIKLTKLPLRWIYLLIT